MNLEYTTKSGEVKSIQNVSIYKIIKTQAKPKPQFAPIALPPKPGGSGGQNEYMWIEGDDMELLKELNAIDFYSKTYPKSLGMEFVNTLIFPTIESFEISISDKLNTFVEHIVFQISSVCTKENATLFITGGGVYNNYLIERIQFYLKNTKVILPDDKTIQFKEALIFGFLGVLRLRNEINVLASVTGARENHSSGVVFD